MPPTYDYSCDQCTHHWHVTKRMADYASPEACPQCGVTGKKIPSRFGFTGASDWNRQEFNHGLGCVATPKQAEKIAKANGLIPIGNESPDAMHKKFDNDRAERREQRYRDAANLK